jgi:predicted ATP-grasp superfamily ATP-dependent carboligase
MLSNKLIRWINRADLPPAVVVGTSLIGLTVARALARHGAPVIAIDHRRRRYTSYSGAFHLLLIPSDTFHTADLASFLHDFAGYLPRKAALILTMDEPVNVIGEHGQGLKEDYHFEFPSPEAVKSLGDKGAFYDLALENNWPVPRTFLCNSTEELTRVAPDLRYPVIVKPQTKTRDFRANSPRKAFKCADREELLSSYGLMAQWESEAIVQEFIRGTDSDVYFSFHYLASDMTEVCTYQGKKIRQYRPECGSTASAVGVQNEELANAARDLLTSAGCAGFGSVEYKRDPASGSYFITEPTVGRPNMQVGVALANGVDIISQGYYHMIGQSYPKPTQRTYHKKWIIFKSDLRSARHYISKSEITWTDYLKSIRGPKKFAVWEISDPKMVLGAADYWGRRVFRYVLNRAGRLLGSSKANHSEPAQPKSDALE